MGVSGNRMAGSSEVTELVMLVCLVDNYVQTGTNRAIGCLDLKLEFIGGCESGWSFNQYEDTHLQNKFKRTWNFERSLKGLIIWVRIRHVKDVAPTYTWFIEQPSYELSRCSKVARFLMRPLLLAVG